MPARPEKAIEEANWVFNGGRSRDDLAFIAMASLSAVATAAVVIGGIYMLARWFWG